MSLVFGAGVFAQHKFCRIKSSSEKFQNQVQVGPALFDMLI